MNEETFSKIIKLLEARIVKLEKANIELKKMFAVQIAKLKNIVTEKDKILYEQADQIAFLLKENKRLVGELRKYSNENTPSGSIPPYLKPALRREVEEANKEPKQEVKHNPRNNRPEVHDRERDVTLQQCPHCGGTRLRKKKTYSRTTLHIRLPSVESVLNKIHVYTCLDCKKEVTAKLPDALPYSKFDLTTAIFISVLFTAFNLSEDKISELFRMIFKLDISPGSISNTLARLKEYLKGDYKKLEQEIEKAKFVHRDDTGWRKNGETNWLSVASTANTVYFKINKRLNAKNAKKLKLAKNCVQISDAHSVYNNTCKEQQKDWAHLSRLAKKPKHYFKNNKDKQDYEKRVSKIMKLYSQAKKDKLELGCSKKLQKEYDEKLLELLGEKNKRENRWIGKNALSLKKYILKQQGKWFTFLKYEYVAPTNNKAEREIRHPVIKRKISQQNRSTRHMHSYEMQASLYATSKARGLQYPQTLQEIITPQLTGEI